MKHLTAFSIPLSIALSQPILAATFVTGGHIDFPAFGYDTADGFEPHIHNEGGPDGAIIGGVRVEDESEYEPDELVVLVKSSSTITLGTTTYYVLPETETAAANSGVPFVGIGLEELEATDWVGGTVTLTLLSMTGPGQLRMWQDDGFGGEIDFIDTEGGLLSFELEAGSHTHYSWGFTELGDYELEFQISGMHVTDDEQFGSATYTFAVPEPSTALLGFGGLALALRRRR